jgi:DNA-directed RNA polymerase subunit RPC12/RpoP
MAVIYRCDTCNKLVEKDKDIVKMKFMMYSMREGIPDNFADWSETRIVCTECRDKILKFGNFKLEEES